MTRRLHNAKKGRDYQWNWEVVNPYLEKDVSGDYKRRELLAELKDIGEFQQAEYLQKDIDKDFFIRDIMEGYLLLVGRLEV